MHTQNQTSNSSAHINRTSKVTYLLEPNSDKNLYFSTGVSQEYFLQKAELRYQEVVGQKMQKVQKTKMFKEAVLNTNSETSIEDIKFTFENLKNEFGGHQILEIAIHNDEGYFYNIEEDLEYRPNKDIFYNDQNRKFYLDKKLTVIADMTKFVKKFNHHAHVIYSNFDFAKGKSARMNRADMRKLQTIVADSLGMERGKEFSKAKRQSHWQLKQAHDQKREVKVTSQKTIKEIKSEYKQERERLKASGSATQQDYQALKRKYEALELKAKEDLLKFEKIQKTKKSYEQALISIKPNAKNDKEVAQETILKQKATIDTQNELIERLRANISELEHKIGELESELKLYKGRDRQDKRKNLNEAKQSLKSELTTLTSTEQELLNNADFDPRTKKEVDDAFDKLFAESQKFLNNEENNQILR